MSSVPTTSNTPFLLAEERKHDGFGDEPPPGLEPCAASSRPPSSTTGGATMRTPSNNRAATVLLPGHSTASSTGAALGQRALAEDDPTVVATGEVSKPAASRQPRQAWLSMTPGSFSGSSSTSVGSEQAASPVHYSSTTHPNPQNHVGSIQGLDAGNLQPVAAVDGSSVSGVPGLTDDDASSKRKGNGKNKKRGASTITTTERIKTRGGGRPKKMWDEEDESSRRRPPASPTFLERQDDGRIQINWSRTDHSLNDYQGCFIARGFVTESPNINKPALELVKELLASVSKKSDNVPFAEDAEHYSKTGGDIGRQKDLYFKEFYICDGKKWGEEPLLKEKKNSFLKVLKDGHHGVTYDDPSVWDVQRDPNFYQIMDRVSAGTGTIHVTRAGDEKPRKFAGHRDKPFSNPATFLPLKGKFYALLAVPAECNAAHQADDSDEFHKFLEEYDLTKVVDTFQNSGKAETEVKKGHKAKDIIVKPYLCEPGNVLVFPANLFYHMTITLPNPEGRILAILHPYDHDADKIQFNPV